MAYRFDAEKPIADEVRRVFFEEIDSAVDHLAKHGDKDRDESIHEARKSVKKLRGLLRLVTPLIGKGIYRKENQALRDIGHKLSELRDTRAIIEIFEAVSKEAEARKALDSDLVQSIRSRLEAHKSETEQKINVDETLASAVAALQAVRGHVDHYQLTSEGVESLERGLRDVYRRGRKAMKQAAKVPAADNFHNWRKRVKDHWYHVRLLGTTDTAFAKTREDDLKKLETWLGDDHNLVVLRDTINEDRTRFGHPKLVRQFLALMKEHGQELREKSLDLGGHLYGLKPKELGRELLVPSSANQQPHGSELPSAPSQTASNNSSSSRQPRKKAASAPSQQSRARARA